MTQSISENYINYLTKKNEKLCEILEYTKSKSFQPNEKEVEHIKLYLRKRERLFTELNKIIEDIKDFEAKNDLSSTISNSEINYINEKNNKIIKQIIELDNNNKVIFEEIFSLIKTNIKNTKETAKINQKYSGVYDSAFIGVNFDSSR